MDYFTVGKNFHPEMVVPLWLHAFEELPTLPAAADRLRSILICRGAGIARLQGHRMAFTAPIIFCLNEREDFVVEHSTDLDARILLFHPQCINAALTLENICESDEKLSWSERSDRSWLYPFVKRDSNYQGYLQLGMITVRRMIALFEAINTELTGQCDHFWPCRSRSFFLELLFLLQRVYNNPRVTDTIPLLADSGEIDAVILYLHANYQQKMTISDLTRVFHLNRTALNAKFTEATGLSIMNYLIKLRTQMAAVMLRDTTIPINEIIHRTGFKDTSHFHRMFKKHMGDTPSAYRQKYSWLAV